MTSVGVTCQVSGPVVVVGALVLGLDVLMDLSVDRREPNPWTLPAAALGAVLLLVGLIWTWVFWALALPLAFLGLAFSIGGLRSARRIGGSQWAARVGFLLCCLASVAGVVALAVVASSYDGL
ncbi:hypothetical protein [Streptomyces sp. NPDC005828]|uniref:hypothetical protein n=1 Tax=Streptomyces sp. NPDC005828 TaxID=3157071 RepID=UPI0033DCA671